MPPFGSLPPPYPVLAIVGPTGSGKSELGLFLARELGGEIVSCDSVQVYRELNVGSAKTPPDERVGIAHHLLDVASFRDELTAGAYARLAREAIAGIHIRNRLPVVVGGTGLYLRALFDGLSPAPPRDPALRARLAEIEVRRPGLLHRRLRAIDAASASRIHPRDIQKLIRAIEICALANVPASQAQSIPRDGMTNIRLLKMGLDPDRRQLALRLNGRTEAMFRNGLLDETQHLLGSLSERDPLPRSLGALGYRQAVEVLLGESDLAQAISRAQLRTRQYAKRQMTWFRADKRVRWLTGFGSDPTLRQAAIDLVVGFLWTIPAGSFEDIQHV